jgi:hypothetical protein
MKNSTTFNPKEQMIMAAVIKWLAQHLSRIKNPRCLLSILTKIIKVHLKYQPVMSGLIFSMSHTRSPIQHCLCNVRNKGVNFYLNLRSSDYD